MAPEPDPEPWVCPAHGCTLPLDRHPVALAELNRRRAQDQPKPQDVNR